jgi:hypothetical protein
MLLGQGGAVAGGGGQEDAAAAAERSAKQVGPSPVSVSL